MSAESDSNQVLGTAMITVALLAPAAVAPQELWAKVLMAVQVAFMAWLVVRRPRSVLLSRLGQAWPDRFKTSQARNPLGVRIAQVLGLVATSAALVAALSGWSTACQLLLAVAITSGLTNLFLSYCIGCEIADGVEAKRVARQA